MQLSDALEQEFERMMAHAFRTPFATTVTELVNQLGGTGRGGGTAAAAREMGVAQRDVQRWVKWERGEHTQDARNPDNMRASTREKLETAIYRAPEAQLIKQLRKDGLTVADITGPLDVGGNPEYHEDSRSIHGKHIPGPRLSGMLDLAADGNWGAAAQAFDAAFFDVYGTSGIGMTWADLEVDELDLRAG